MLKTLETEKKTLQTELHVETEKAPWRVYLNNKECKRGQWSVVWLKRGHPCLHHLHVLSTVFSWRPFSSFSLWIILLPSSLPSLILPLLICVTGALVPLAWGLMAGGRGFASHGGVTLSRRWPRHRWKPLDIPGTHLHSVTQLLTKCFAIYRDNKKPLNPLPTKGLIYTSCVRSFSIPGGIYRSSHKWNHQKSCHSSCLDKWTPIAEKGLASCWVYLAVVGKGLRHWNKNPQNQ